MDGVGERGGTEEGRRDGGAWRAAGGGVHEGAVWALDSKSLRLMCCLFPPVSIPPAPKESGVLTEAKAGGLACDPGVPQTAILGKRILHIAIWDARGQVPCKAWQTKMLGTTCSATGASGWRRRWQGPGGWTGRLAGPGRNRWLYCACS